tara:strand:- start:346 stop:546 length:201 start_codon:yes stop_codon:yes gene_type:complete
MSKIIIHTKSIENRNDIFKLITKDLKFTCSSTCGFYDVDKRYKNRNGINHIGIFCEKITLYYKGDE